MLFWKSIQSKFFQDIYPFHFAIREPEQNNKYLKLDNAFNATWWPSL